MKKSFIVHPDELSKKWIDRSVELGCTAIGLHPVGGTRAADSLQKLVDKFEDTQFLSLIDYACSRGLEIEYEMHTARFLLPKSYFEENPSYFRMSKDGERTTDFNFCVTNEAAMEIVEENALTLAKKLYKSSKRFYFWMDDGKDNFCYCEKCRKLTPSDQQMLVMNRILRKIRTEIPDAKLSYLAYYNTFALPASQKPEEGLFVEFAPYERDFTKPAEEMKQEDIAALKKLLEFFGKEDSKILEYWYDNSLFSKYEKPPAKLCVNNEMIRQDLQFYKDLDVENIAVFACFLGADYEELFGEPDVSAFQNI